MSKRMLFVADWAYEPEMIQLLEKELNCTIDIFKIFGKERPREKIIQRHINYFRLAVRTFRHRKAYFCIILGDQYIALYFDLFCRLTRDRDSGRIHFLYNFRYYSIKGIVGAFYKALWGRLLHSPMIHGIQVSVTKEKEIYSREFGEEVVDKLFSIRLGAKQPVPGLKETVVDQRDAYFFAGGTSNRDYPTLIEAFRGLDERLKIACLERDMNGLNVPANVTPSFNTYGRDFEEMMTGSFAVITLLNDPKMVSGLLAIIQGIRLGKISIVSRLEGIEEYFPEDCGFVKIVDIGSPEAVRKAVREIIADRGRIPELSRKAREYYESELTINHYARRVAAVIKGLEAGCRVQA